MHEVRYAHVKAEGGALLWSGPSRRRQIPTLGYDRANQGTWCWPGSLGKEHLAGCSGQGPWARRSWHGCSGRGAHGTGEWARRPSGWPSHVMLGDSVVVGQVGMVLGRVHGGWASPLALHCLTEFVTEAETPVTESGWMSASLLIYQWLSTWSFSCWVVHPSGGRRRQRSTQWPPKYLSCHGRPTDSFLPRATCAHGLRGGATSVGGCLGHHGREGLIGIFCRREAIRQRP